MSRSITRFFAAAALLLLASSCQPDPGAAPGPVAVGVQVGLMAPDFEGPSLGGRPVRLAEYRGRYVLVDFWGTWCPPCRKEVPFLRAAYEAYPRDRFDILAISVNDPPADLRAFIEREGLAWKQIIQYDYDPARRAVVEAFRIDSYPSTFLIDPNGIIVARGGMLRQRNLALTLEKYLGAP
ncbi:MAG: TlpA disulfide reductase family protein [Rhodothermales bacterium]